MLKRFLIPILVSAFLLAACVGKAQTQVVEAAAEEADPASEVAQTEPDPTETPELVAEEPAPVEFVSECTIVSTPMDPATPYADLFAVTGRDWVIGPDDAALTIVEYGDYQ